MLKKNAKTLIIGIIGLFVILTGIFVILSQIKLKKDRLPLPDYKEEKLKIACVGDSITYGLGSTSPAHESYPAKLQQIVGEDYQVINYGISGCTATDDADKPYTKQNYYYESKKIKADIYIIMLGTNDSKHANWNAQHYEQDYTRLIETYMNLDNHPKVYLMNPPMCCDKDDRKVTAVDNTVIKDEIHSMVEKIGTSLGVPVIDLYDLMQDHIEWYHDDVHPNDDGYQHIAEKVAETIEY